MRGTPNTRTTERVESMVETVEITEYQCTNCNQWFTDELEIVPVALNADPEKPAKADEAAVLCSQCAESIFGYEHTPDARFTKLADAVADKTPDVDLTSVSITVTVFAITTWVGLQVVNKVASNVDEAELKQAFQEVATTGAPGLFDLFGVLLTVSLIVVVVGYLMGMPRRR